jgi:hypothetical protein
MFSALCMFDFPENREQKKGLQIFDLNLYRPIGNFRFKGADMENGLVGKKIYGVSFDRSAVEKSSDDFGRFQF